MADVLPWPQTIAYVLRGRASRLRSSIDPGMAGSDAQPVEAKLAAFAEGLADDLDRYTVQDGRAVPAEGSS